METYLRDLVSAQAHSGEQVSVLVHQSSLGLFSKAEEYETLDRHKINLIRAAVWARAFFTPISPIFPILLYRLIKKNKPDILHLHLPNISVFWALLLPNARRIPWVIQWQSDVVPPEDQLSFKVFIKIYRYFERTLLEKSGAIIASSPPYLHSSRALKSFKKKCHVIPLGIDYRYLPKPIPDGVLDYSESPLKILAIGRLTYYKGFEFLISALTECDGVQVNFVGKGDQFSNLWSMTKRLRLDDRIFFHGDLDAEELSRHFLKSHCLCLPSVERTEAFGLVLLEALFFEKPALISKVEGSGMSWIIEDGLTGLHFKPRDSRDLARCIRKFRDDHSLRKSLASNSREVFDRRFHIGAGANKIRRVYDRVH